MTSRVSRSCAGCRIGDSNRLARRVSSVACGPQGRSNSHRGDPGPRDRDVTPLCGKMQTGCRNPGQGPGRDEVAEPKGIPAMTRRLAIALALAWLVSAPGVLTAAEPTRRPNILVILADDMGYADIGVDGCKD